MIKQAHLTPDDLMLFMDHEMDATASSDAESHLLSCEECQAKLRVLEKGDVVYREYHEQILKPALPIPAWAPLRQRQKKTLLRPAFLWPAAGALACGLMVLLVQFRPQDRLPQAQEVLSDATAVPEDISGNLVLTSGTTRMYRPAFVNASYSDRGLRHVKALFVQANYSWEKPLSARSFAAWRRSLPARRDSVISIRGEDGRRFYRVRTQSNSGVLRTASLTLRADSFHATRANFEFQGEEPLEISQQNDVPKQAPIEAQSPALVPHPKIVETVVGPEDELRVFAALSALASDAEDPVEVKLDEGHHHVVVTGLGIPSARRKQLETALAGLPNTIVQFSSRELRQRAADSTPTSITAGDNGSVALRERLQERAGGESQLQGIIDRSLDSSSALFARSHALLVLAQQFPPQIEAGLSADGGTTLTGLRQRQVGAMEYALGELKDGLKPLFPEEFGTGSQLSNTTTWQEGANELFNTSRNFDRTLSRLLAGTYSSEMGDQMLKQVPVDLLKIEKLLRLQASAGAK